MIVYFEMECPKKKRYMVRKRFFVLAAIFIVLLFFLLRQPMKEAFMAGIERLNNWAAYWLI